MRLGLMMTGNNSRLSIDVYLSDAAEIHLRFVARSFRHQRRPSTDA